MPTVSIFLQLYILLLCNFSTLLLHSFFHDALRFHVITAFLRSPQSPLCSIRPFFSLPSFSFSNLQQHSMVLLPVSQVAAMLRFLTAFSLHLNEAIDFFALILHFVPALHFFFFAALSLHFALVVCFLTVLSLHFSSNFARCSR